MGLTTDRATTDHRDSTEPDIADTISEPTKSAAGTGGVARCSAAAERECGGAGSSDSLSGRVAAHRRGYDGMNKDFMPRHGRSHDGRVM
jgi:hypothetical protein